MCGILADWSAGWSADGSGLGDEVKDCSAGGGGLAGGMTSGAGDVAISAVIPAGDLAPHAPWIIATMAAMQETATTRRKAMTLAPIASLYVDDAR